VFLHGFGGQLSVYLKVLVEELGDDFVIVAPFLDHAGRWWTPDGEAIVRDLVERRLPAAADRDRVVLVGLSNGGIGAARLVQAGPARALFRGAILLSGVADPLAADLSGVDLLVITGAADPRFPLAAVERSAELLRARGASVALDVLDGDHFIVLSHKRDVADRIRAWLAPRLR
jgi:predicted esterase